MVAEELVYVSNARAGLLQRLHEAVPDVTFIQATEVNMQSLCDLSEPWQATAVSPNCRGRLDNPAQPRHPIARLTAAVIVSTVVLSSISMTGPSWAASPTDQTDQQAAAVAQPEDNPQAQRAAAQLDRSLDIIIAEHVILWDGRIRSWDEVVTELRELRQLRGGPIKPKFSFTNGAHAAGHYDTYKAKAYEVYKELFEPVGMTLSSISPRAGLRYDSLRTAEDLIGDPKTLRSGLVTRDGQPQPDVLVVLAPEAGALPIMLKPDLSLRDPRDEVWALTDPDGRFTLAAIPRAELAERMGSHSLVAISSNGYGLAAIPAEGEEVQIELLPMARLELALSETVPQQISLSFLGGLPSSSPGFAIYEIRLHDKPLALGLLAGKITISRNFQRDDGGSRSYPAETADVAAGQSWAVELATMTEQEAMQKWIETSIRPRVAPEPIEPE